MTFNKRIGSVGISFNTRFPFQWFLRTLHFVEADPETGPVNVRAMVFFLWFVVSYNSNGKLLKQAKELWANSPELQAQTKEAVRQAEAAAGRGDAPLH